MTMSLVLVCNRSACIMINNITPTRKIFKTMSVGFLPGGHPLVLYLASKKHSVT